MSCMIVRMLGRYGITYAELRDVLREGRKLKGFPLVDNPDQMVLLGSIRRQELISAIESQVGRERRLAEVSLRRKEAENNRRKQDQESRIKTLTSAFEKSSDQESEDAAKLQIVDEGSPQVIILSSDWLTCTQ